MVKLSLFEIIITSLTFLLIKFKEKTAKQRNGIKTVLNKMNIKKNLHNNIINYPCQKTS